MTEQQVREMLAIMPWDRENSIKHFARRHNMTLPSVYYWRRKLGLTAKRKVRRG